MQKRTFNQEFYNQLPKHWQEYVDLRGGFRDDQFDYCVIIRHKASEDHFIQDAFLVHDEDRQELAIFSKDGYMVYHLGTDELWPEHDITSFYQMKIVPHKNIITDAETKKIASLARLELSDTDTEEMSDKLNQIVGYVERLEDIDTEGIEPLAHPLDIRNVFREDMPTPSLSADEALANAPDRQGDYFGVPAVFEK